MENEKKNFLLSESYTRVANLFLSVGSIHRLLGLLLNNSRTYRKTQIIIIFNNDYVSHLREQEVLEINSREEYSEFTEMIKKWKERRFKEYNLTLIEHQTIENENEK